MSQEPQPDVKPEGKVTIKVAYNNDQEMVFSIKRTKTFEKLFAAFHDRLGAAPGTYTFRTEDGDHNVTPDSTPKMFEMSVDEENVLLAHAHQVGGAEGSPTEDKKIAIRVVWGQDESVVYAIKRTKTLEKLFKAFHDARQAAPNTYRFTYDGKRLTNDDTPKTLEMDLDEDNQVDAHVVQVGGSCLA